MKTVWSLGRTVCTSFSVCKDVMPPATEILVNSLRDLEPQIDRLIKTSDQISKIPVRSVGPLLPDPPCPSSDDKWGTVQKWLDNQKEKSVVYVSFGSMAVPSPKQLNEMANTLLATNQPFMWSLREYQQKFLPDAAHETINQQYVSTDPSFFILSWVPQLEVLSHHSVGVFVSHCGWNGTLETLSNGVPVVAWPLFSDQQANADLQTRRCRRRWRWRRQGVAVRIMGTGLKAENVIRTKVLEAEIRKVGEWSKRSGAPDTSFHGKALEFSKLAREALTSRGSTTQDFGLFLDKLAQTPEFSSAAKR